MTFTTEQKLEAVSREIGFRRRVYARRVGDGKMRQDQADREIAVMEAIKADYERIVATNEPALF